MSTTNLSSRPAYKVEELLALRNSASESRVSLEKFSDEDVVKEHVLNNPPCSETTRITENIPPRATAAPIDGPIHSTIFDAQTYRARTGQVVAPPEKAGKRPSPTPSFKRNKIQSLIKEHGSPPDMRVTAGGRIVPNDLAQLGSPRFPPTHAHQDAGANGHARSQPVPTNPRIENGTVAHHHTGKLAQWIDGRWTEVPVDHYGRAHYCIPHLGYFHGIVSGPLYPPVTRTTNVQQRAYQQPATANNVVPEDIENQIAVSKAEYERVRQEKIELERHEVKASDQMSAAQRAQIVDDKRKFVLMLDTIRRKIKELEALKSGSPPSASFANLTGSVNGGTGVSALPTPVFDVAGIDGSHGLVPGYAWPMHPAFGPGAFPWPGFLPAMTAAPVSIHQPGQQQAHHVSPSAVESPISEPSPSSRAQPRRSHAVQIRNPATTTAGPFDNMSDGPSNNNTCPRTLSASGELPSNLNPTSPSYEPGKPYPLFPLTGESPPHFVVPAPTPIETPNPPPAELARHWVFSQEETITLTETTRDGVRTGKDGEKECGIKLQNGGDEMMMGMGKVQVHQPNHSSNDDNMERSSQRPTSHSSVTTTDFFPTNTHEHSFSKFMSRKTSGTACLSSVEGNPRTPMRDQRSDVVSPMTEQHQPPAPPVSPVANSGFHPHLLANSPEDMRMSSFLRDTARQAQRVDEEYIPQHSPVRPETRDEFHGKSKAYLEGYLAGSSGNQPADPTHHEYCSGYIDGLSKMCLASGPRDSSTASPKSKTVSVSSTPPNTTNNQSFIAELAGGQPGRAEIVRLTQSLNFSSPPARSNHPGNEPSDYDGIAHTTGPYSSHDAHTRSRVTSGSYQVAASSQPPRSWSEDHAGIGPHKGSFHQATGKAWAASFQNAPSQHVADGGALLDLTKSIHNPLSSVGTQTLPSTTHTVDRRSDRVVSTSITSQASLTGYSGNTKPTARVGSVPQHTVFGDDKYVVKSPKSATIYDASHQYNSFREPLHENQPSVSTVSRGSQFDGAMDDLAEMKTPMQALPAAGNTSKQGQTQPHVQMHSANLSSTSYPVPPTPQSTRPKLPTTNTDTSTVGTPTASPSKSNTSPKKITSPRHRMQQLASRAADKMGEMLDRGARCDTTGAGERSGPVSRAESPDPALMNKDDKRRWKDGWRQKLGAARQKEDAEFRKWKKEKDGQGGLQ